MRDFVVAALVAFALSWAPHASALDKDQKVPAIDLKDFSGKAWDKEALQGHVVLIDFWASWCKPCNEEMPFLEALYNENKAKGFVVLGVSVDEDRKTAEAFAKKMKISFPVVHDADRKVASRFRPKKMPSSYLIDAEGNVIKVHRGFRASDAKVIRAAVVNALK